MYMILSILFKGWEHTIMLNNKTIGKKTMTIKTK